MLSAVLLSSVDAEATPSSTVLATVSKAAMTALAPRVLTQWGRVHDEVTRALLALRPSGGTSIYDAIIESLPMVEHRSRQRAALQLAL